MQKQDGGSAAARLERAEEIYASAFAEAVPGGGTDLQQMCQAHPDLTAELQQVHGHAQVAADLIRRVRGGLAPDPDATPAGDASDLTGRRITHYDVIERLGAGAMGEVYLARDRKLDREVALKVLAPRFAADQEHKSRFLREARLASRLTHPNIATIHEANEVGGTLFFVMELVRGDTLESRVRRGGLSSREFLEIAIPLADGLAEAHRGGVVHRDLKPANIMVDERGRPKILDFGLSRPTPDRADHAPFQTSSGVLMGTPAFMAPERLKSSRVDPKSDLFSLGAILYYLATGQRPFPGRSQAEALDAILHHDPPPVHRSNPHLEEELGWVITRLLEKDPRQRTQSAEELLAELRAIEARLTGGHKPVRRKRRRSLLVAGVAVAVGIAVLQPWRMVLGAEPALLAILPFSAPAGNETAAGLARTMVYALPEELACSQIDVLSPRYLSDLAKQEAIQPGTLDFAQGARIAQKAGAHYMLAGDFEPAGAGWDLHWELLEPERGRSVLSRKIPGVRADQMAETIAGLAAAVRDHFGVSAGGTSRLSRDPGALDAYTAGMQAMERADWQQAQRLFRQAAQRDPEFALAHYQEARTITWQWTDSLDEAQAAIDAALRDPASLSPVDREKALLFQELVETGYEVNKRGFAARARDLAQRNPRDKDAQDLWMEYAHHHVVEGRARDTVQACQRLLELDPDYAPAFIHLQPASAWTGDRELCRDASEGILRRAELSADAMIALVALERSQEARELIQERGRNPRFRRDRMIAIFAALAMDDAVLAGALADIGWDGDAEAFNAYRAEARLALGMFGEARGILKEMGTDLGDGQTIAARYELGLDPLPDPTGPLWGRAFRAAWLARRGEIDAARRELSTITPQDLAAPRVRRLHTWAEGEIAAARGQETLALQKFLEAAPLSGEVENGRVATFTGFLVERAARALLDSGQHADAEEYLLRFEEEPESLRYLGRFLVKPSGALIRAQLGRARCAEAAGRTGEAEEYYARFLRRWSAPDPELPEIQTALDRWRSLKGAPWQG